MLQRSCRSLRPDIDISSHPEAHISYSQFGEDLAIISILETHKRAEAGYYIDAGAFHPFLYSNTALLHMFKGWKGVNIDANPDVISAFNDARPNDHNILAALNDVESQLQYAMFNHGAVNSLDPKMIDRQERTAGSPFKVVKRVEMTTKRLDQILSEVSDVPDDIGLLSVDCEGLDFNVLNSLNLTRYRPFLIAVETHGMNLSNPSKSTSHQLLTENGYDLISHVFVTSIYKRR